MGVLSIEIVTPQGLSMKDDDIDEVIIRRREEQLEKGSYISILPRHGSMLVRIPDGPMKYYKRGNAYPVHLTGGFVEVKDDQVTFLVSSFKQLSTQPIK